MSLRSSGLQAFENSIRGLLQRLHVVVRQSEMMADLVHQHVRDDIAESVLVPRPSSRASAGGRARSCWASASARFQSGTAGLSLETTPSARTDPRSPSRRAPRRSRSLRPGSRDPRTARGISPAGGRIPPAPTLRGRQATAPPRFAKQAGLPVDQPIGSAGGSVVRIFSHKGASGYGIAVVCHGAFIVRG